MGSVSPDRAELVQEPCYNLATPAHQIQFAVKPTSRNITMSNSDIQATWSYHDGTKHSLLSLQNDPHYMDFDNQPLPFKIYSDLEPVPLPSDLPMSEVPALHVIAAESGHSGRDNVPRLGTLASIFHHSAGITRRRRIPGGEILFRAAACTGALYHIELYLVCGDLPDLKAGVYHFDAHDFALRKLREGDFRSVLVQASGHEPAIENAPAIVICTGTFWRNAWKYRSRTYRHCFWDNGTMLANLLAISAAHRVPAKIIAGFVDETVNGLLSIDPQREVALSLVALGYIRSPSAGPAPESSPLDLKTVPLSRTEVDYPAIRAMHTASSIATPEEVEAWRGQTPIRTIPEASGPLYQLQPDLDAESTNDSVEHVVVRRGSSRQFVHSSITVAQLSNMLHCSTQGVPADFLEPEGAMLNDLYVIVHSVDGLPPGAFVFNRDRKSLELLKQGDFRREAGFLGLQQALPADASANVFFLADLKPMLERYGNRGYRVAQLEAGIVGGKLYLGAYAQHLGATGLTFFDDDVTTFFSPHAEGKSVMFLVAIGVPLRRRIVRR